jgi:hypothetical protein
VYAKVNYVTLTYTLIAPAIQIDTFATALSRAARNEATPLSQLTQAARISPAPIEPGREERAPASKCPGARFEDATATPGPGVQGSANIEAQPAHACQLGPEAVRLLQRPCQPTFFVAFDTTDFDV